MKDFLVIQEDKFSYHFKIGEYIWVDYWYYNNVYDKDRGGYKFPEKIKCTVFGELVSIEENEWIGDDIRIRMEDGLVYEVNVNTIIKARHIDKNPKLCIKS